ncbi:hypothetical protein HYS54_04535 [Candidatus Micrarchaeota archaeon]|nr:hypothetical protein [Candidatus Micrarchaeota archaeon]
MKQPLIIKDRDLKFLRIVINQYHARLGNLERELSIDPYLGPERIEKEEIGERQNILSRLHRDKTEYNLTESNENERLNLKDALIYCRNNIAVDFSGGASRVKWIDRLLNSPELCNIKSREKVKIPPSISDVNRKRITFIIAFLVALAFIYILLSSVSVRPDVSISIYSNQSDFTHVSKNQFFSSTLLNYVPYYGVFQKQMNFQSNISFKSYRVSSIKEMLLEKLGMNTPVSGDKIYLTLKIKNDGDTFSSYLDYIVTDDAGYIIGRTNFLNNSERRSGEFSNECAAGNFLTIKPNDEKMLNIELDTPKSISNGNYKVYVLFYKPKETNPQWLESCYQSVDEKKSFYTIIPFSIYYQTGGELVTLFIVGLYGIVVFFLDRLVPSIFKLTPRILHWLSNKTAHFKSSKILVLIAIVVILAYIFITRFFS